ncbi:DUF308 domain-containing protein [Spirosoma arcticum]
MDILAQKQNQPWWLRYIHNACYGLMGVVLLVNPTQASMLHEALRGSLLGLAGLATALFGIRRHQYGERDNYWFILSSIRDMLFGIALLIIVGDSLRTMVNLLGLWAIIYAFLQAIEANFYFLGTRSIEAKVYWVELIHFFCVLVAGGFAYTLVMRPEGLVASMGFVGLFLIGLGILQCVLTWRLKNMVSVYTE